MNITFEYVAKDNSLYKRDKKDKSLNPWDIYNPKSGIWEVDKNIHPEFTEGDLIAESEILKLKQELNKKYHPETATDFIGRYIYFENSHNLYKVINNKLEANLYLSNGAWDHRINRLTLVGVKNNVISNEKAEAIMCSIDGKKPTKASSEEVDGSLVGEYLLVNNKLLRVVDFQNSRNFKRYKCNEYLGKGIWQYAGFYVAGTISKNIINKETTARMMKEKDEARSDTVKSIVSPKEIEVKNVDLYTVPNTSSEALKNETTIYTSDENKEEHEANFKAEEEKDISITENYFPKCESHGTATEGIKPKKAIVINRPLMIQEGMTIKIKLDDAEASCEVCELIDYEEHNITVEGCRAESIADVFSLYMGLDVNKERITKLVQEKLEETYIKLKFNDATSGKDSYMYLSKCDLEKKLLGIEVHLK